MDVWLGIVVGILSVLAFMLAMKFGDENDRQEEESLDEEGIRADERTHLMDEIWEYWQASDRCTYEIGRVDFENKLKALCEGEVKK